MACSSIVKYQFFCPAAFAPASPALPSMEDRCTSVRTSIQKHAFGTLKFQELHNVGKCKSWSRPKLGLTEVKKKSSSAHRHMVSMRGKTRARTDEGEDVSAPEDGKDSSTSSSSSGGSRASPSMEERIKLLDRYSTFARGDSDASDNESLLATPKAAATAAAPAAAQSALARQLEETMRRSLKAGGDQEITVRLLLAKEHEAVSNSSTDSSRSQGRGPGMESTSSVGNYEGNGVAGEGQGKGQAAGGGLTIHQRRNIKRQAYLDRVAQRDDAPFFTSVALAVLLPPAFILGAAIASGYVEVPF
eukprot:jgi/Mesen1/5636/ME000284S04875